MITDQDPNSDKDHNARATVWREILAIYGILAAALLVNWCWPALQELLP